MAKTYADAIKIVERVIAEIEECEATDSEWTSPRGNGTNWCEAYETAMSILYLLKKTKGR